MFASICKQFYTQRKRNLAKFWFEIHALAASKPYIVKLFDMHEAIYGTHKIDGIIAFTFFYIICLNSAVCRRFSSTFKFLLGNESLLPV